MKRWLLWGSLILLALAAVLAATLPAAVVWRHIAPNVPDLALESLSGTVWRGEAGNARVRGFALGKLRWQLAPLSLLSAPTVRLALDGKDLDLETTVRSSGTDTEFTSLTATTDAAWLSPALAIPELKPEGELDIAIERLLIGQNGIPSVIAGSARWRKAAVTGRVRADLGDIELSARTINKKIELTARDDGRGALIVNGNFEIEGSTYRGRVALTPRNADPALIEALQWIGAPQPDGSRLLIVDGTIRATQVQL